MRNLSIYRITFLAGMVFSGGISFAQRDSASYHALQEVVITASRESETVLSAPRTITVINRDKIEGSVYNSVGDLLAKQQGIYVVGANQTPGTNQSLFLRGANSNQVTVLIDGVRITDPSTPNNVIDLSELSLTNVERIEIMEGAHSTLFGGSAIGGVVNIITRKNQSPGVHGFVGIQGGTFGGGSNTFSQQADISAALKNGLYFNGSVFNQKVAGLNAAIDTAKNGRTPDKDGFSKTDYYLKAGYRKGSLDAFASYKNTHQRAEIDAGAYQDDDNDYVQFDRDLINYGINYQLNDHWKLSGVGSYSTSKRLNENDSSLVTGTVYDGNYSKDRYNGTLATNEITATYSIGKTKVLAGVGQFSEKMSFNTYFYSSSFGGFESTTNYDSIKTKASTRYAFGQVQWHGGENGKWGLTAGGRLSNHSLFGNYSNFEISPSVALSTNSLLYGSVASGYNAPSLYQLFDPTRGFLAYTTRGNPDLRPETSISYEIGFKQQFGNGSFLTTSIFQTNTKNVIEYVYLWNGATAVNTLTFDDYFGDTYINLSRQKVSGAELAGRVVFGDKLSFNGNVTYTQGKISYSPSDIDKNHTGDNHVQIFSNGVFLDQETETNHLVRRPRVTSYGQFQYKAIQALSFTAGYRLAGSRFDSAYDPTLGPFGALAQPKVQSYFLLDFGAVWQITKAFSVIGKLENLLDQPYSEINGYATRGRSGYVKLNFKW